MPTTSQQLLQKTGDFLSLTRQHEWSLPETFSFEVAHQASNTKSLVSVLDTGIITFEPLGRATQKDIILSSAVHGNETAPIEICADIIAQLIKGELPLAERVMFLFGNPASMNIAKRFVEENLNRLFSGAHSEGDVQNKERDRAKVLEQAVTNFYTDLAAHNLQAAGERERYHYDLHTAIRGSKNDKFAVYPFRHGKPWKKSQLCFLQACDVTTILLSHSPTTTFSYFSSNNFGADAFTVELGKVMPFGENDMTKFTKVRDTLTRFVSGQPLALAAYDGSAFDIFEIDQTINKYTEGFTLHFADDAENFTDFPVGYVLATDGDVEHKVRTKGEAIIFPNANVALDQRALLTVKPTTLD
ncbi:succinylglutamate desuccinylase [Thalassotalea euphylliae]|uniref:Succinylglutamate desuccinylase n=1 Tax=Thalassotalea euphylliae TaxID=1655234 RepID=A0A3E0TRP0_9GAMM|nr:succinylglutamate desuccinylase [Thalassotalea euphylliae]REL27301.1 succinylglutamate desuccinylase [Thalassotalea euphylliae]